MAPQSWCWKVSSHAREIRCEAATLRGFTRSLLPEIMGLVGTSASPASTGEKAQERFLIKRREQPLKVSPSFAGLQNQESVWADNRG